MLGTAGKIVDFAGYGSSRQNLLKVQKTVDIDLAS